MLGLFLSSVLLADFLSGGKKCIQLVRDCVLAHVAGIFLGLLGCTWSVWCCWRDYCKPCPSYEMLEVSGPSHTCRYPSAHWVCHIGPGPPVSMLTSLCQRLHKALFGVRPSNNGMQFWTTSHSPSFYREAQGSEKVLKMSTVIQLVPGRARSKSLLPRVLGYSDSSNVSIRMWSCDNHSPTCCLPWMW